MRAVEAAPVDAPRRKRSSGGRVPLPVAGCSGGRVAPTEKLAAPSRTCDVVRVDGLGSALVAGSAERGKDPLIY